METLADLPELMCDPDGSQRARVQYLQFLRAVQRFFHRKQHGMLHKYIFLQKESDGGLAKDDGDRPVIRQAVRNVYGNCTNPAFSSTAAGSNPGISNLTVDAGGHERDWVTLPGRREHLSNLVTCSVWWITTCTAFCCRKSKCRASKR